MENTLNQTMMEKLVHPNQMFPISEFVDNFRLFRKEGFPSHWHHEMEFHILLKGSAEYRVNGITYTVEEGSAFYIAPETIHTAKGLSESTIGYNVLLLPKLLINIMGNINCEKYALPLTTNWPEALVITPDRKEGHRITDTLKKMYDMESTHFAYELFLLKSIMEIWYNLLPLLPDSTKEFKDPRIVQREQRMKSMIDYIHQNYALPITVQDVAAAANVSKSECFRCFAELSKMTPVEYINKFRLLQASNLLLFTDKSISDICFMTGFNNTSYFTQKFKHQYGISPKTYRAEKCLCNPRKKGSQK